MSWISSYHQKVEKDKEGLSFRALMEPGPAHTLILYFWHQNCANKFLLCSATQTVVLPQAALGEESTVSLESEQVPSLGVYGSSVPSQICFLEVLLVLGVPRLLPPVPQAGQCGPFIRLILRGTKYWDASQVPEHTSGSWTLGKPASATWCFSFPF